MIAGRRILVPVTAGRRDLAVRLMEAGALVDEVEFISVIGSSDAERLTDATLAWCDGGFDWLAVTSRNAVLAMRRVARGYGRELSEGLSAGRVATVGEATRGTCASVGLDVTLVPTERHDALGIVKEFPEGPGSVLVPLGDLASPVLARGLAKRGWTVTQVEAYRVIDGPGIAPEIAQALASGEFDAVLLTSGSVAERYAPFAAPADADTLVVAIGATTAASARAAGLTVDATSKVPSYDGILAVLEEAWASAKEGA